MDGGGRTASGTAVERSLQRILRPRHLHIHVLRNAGAVADDCMDAGGTTPWMGEVERRLEQPSRATQEQLPSVLVTSKITVPDRSPSRRTGMPNSNRKHRA
jgi:hypothetical protein